MHLDTTDPEVTLVEDRPIIVPAFCLLFFVIGIYQLASGLVHGGWDTNDAFGTLVCLLFGGGLFLFTARRDSYRFDSRRRMLDWKRRSLLSESRGSLSFDEIERVLVHRGPASDDTTYRVVYTTTDGELVPLSHGYTAGERHHREVAAAIEAALRR